MADTVDKAARSRIMAKVLSENTKPEVKVRTALQACGCAFFEHQKELPGKPDFVFPRYRIAVFVHGCFWHWHGCKRSRMPESNKEYWTAKIDRNVQRDKKNLAALVHSGWKVRILWECELKAGIEHLLAELANIRAESRLASRRRMRNISR